MKTAFSSADIFIPKEDVDRSKWAVIACDQFTSEPEYWQETRRIVGDAPSSLSLILPEVYLGQEEEEAKLEEIRNKMEEYEQKGYFEVYPDALIYLERIDSSGRLRQGLVGKLDLLAYDYRKDSRSQVRATEETVEERIPPRMRVRQQGNLELSHTMVLIDDEKKRVIEPLALKKEKMKKLYDVPLMQGGGHVTGYLLGKEEQEEVEAALEELYNRKMSDQKEGFFFGIGDGNHSLATAKEYYEGLKKEKSGEDMLSHPARYALVELVNLYSPALFCKAIDRIVTETNPEHLINAMVTALGLLKEGEGQKIALVQDGKEENWTITKPTSHLAVGSVQQFLDDYLKQNPGKIDYIHGKDRVRDLAQQPGNVGILLPDMKKEELFPTVIKEGVLPRKTFSMGNARDKRYYMEARKIQNNVLTLSVEGRTHN